MRMFRRFRKAKHRCKANVRTFHLVTPFSPGLGLEDGGDTFLHLRPMGAVRLRRQICHVEAKRVDQHTVKLGLIRADADMFAVLGLVDIIVMAATIKPVHSALIQMVARRISAITGGHQ